MIVLFDKQNPHIPSIPPRKIDMAQCCGGNSIEISSLWPLAKMREYEIRLDTKIPKELSILPKINSDDIATVRAREGSKIYVQIGDQPAFATLEQLKEISTKTVFVDELSDTKIKHLSNEDIVMLKKE